MGCFLCEIKENYTMPGCIKDTNRKRSDIDFRVSDYISHFVSFSSSLRIFQDSLPSLENQHLIYHIAQEDERDVAIQNKHLLKEFLDSCGFELKIDIEEMKVSQKVLEVKMKKEEPKPVKVYEEKKAYNLNQKEKKVGKLCSFFYLWY